MLKGWELGLTRTEPTSAAIAKISAQETIPGQLSSTAVLMLFTTSKPLSEFRFGSASCSLSMVSVLFSKTDPSQPCHQNNNFILDLSLYI